MSLNISFYVKDHCLRKLQNVLEFSINKDIELKRKLTLKNKIKIT